MRIVCRFHSSLSILVISLTWLFIAYGDATLALAQWPTPKLTALSPSGGQVGTTVEVTVRGADLDDLVALRFSHPGIAATPQQKSATPFTPARNVPLQFNIRIDGTVPPGEYEVWGIGRFGISNSKRFQVGPHPEQVETGSHGTADSAIELPVNHTQNGTCDPNARDYYRIALAKDQRVVIACDGQRIGSRAMLTVELYDANGHELERSRNERGGDPVTAFVAPEAMDLFVAVRDFVYRGGDEYFYRLHVHDGPQVAMTWPPVITRSTRQSIEMQGWNLAKASGESNSLPVGKPMSVDHGPFETVLVEVDPQELLLGDSSYNNAQHVADPRLATIEFVEYVWPTDKGRSNSVRLYVSDFPIVVEKTEGDAQRVTLPVEYVGRFEDARDRDAVRFDARQGEVIWIEVLSETLGCTTDPELHVSQIVRDEEGNEQVKVLAVVDDSADRNQRIGTDFDLSTDDPSYRLVVPADGEYQVQVNDLFYGASDPRNFYRLQIGKRTPDFAALTRPVLARPPNPNTVTVSSLVLRRGQLVTLDIVLDRQYGFDGPVEIVPTQLPAGVTHLPLIIQPGSSAGALTFYAALDAPLFEGDLDLVARGTINDQTVERPVQIGTAFWGTPNRAQLLPEFRLTESLPVSVLDFETEPVAVLPAWTKDHPNLRESPQGEVFTTSRGGTLEIPLQVDRRNGFAEALKLNPVGVPGELGLQPIDVAGDATAMNVSIKATNANLKPGHYRLIFQTDTKWKYQRNPQGVAAAQQEQQRLVALLDEQTKKIEAQKAQLGKLQAEQSAAEAIAQTQAQLNEADAQLTLLQQLKTEADQAVEAATNANKEVELVETIRSWPINIQIVDSPIRITSARTDENNPAKPAEITAKPGAAVELPVTLEREFGFSGPVDVMASLPEPLQQIAIEKVTLASDQVDGRLQFKLPEDSPTGRFSITIQAAAKFNDVDINASNTVTVNIEAASSSE